MIDQNNYLFLILFSIFLIFFFSNIKKLNSVSLRFFLQIILILFFVNIIGLEIKNTRIEFVDTIISNKIANTIFVSFCLMVLVNGSNFIDGLNGLLLKYYLIIYLVILFSFNQTPYVDTDFIIV